ARFDDRGTWPPQPTLPEAPTTSIADLAQAGTLLIDLATSANHVRRHIPGAWWALRSHLGAAMRHIAARASAQRWVLSCETGTLARFAAADAAALTDRPVSVLTGGNASWFAGGGAVESGETRLASPRIDRYRRPYEGTDAPREAMQGYLDWEYGLVAQLGRDATHGFQVLA
ncbi:MAG: rhodanese-related sulfurtransferase, partial [Burkholderiales bacterium]|nr:rhodanese-related sulfurtransferase [Burkholderiales bacterium]